MSAEVPENTNLQDTDKRPGGHQPISPHDKDARAGYLAFTAHEVRNPLSTALWSAELLARMATADRGGARGEKLAQMCLRALTRLRLLIEDHFLIERLEAGGLPMRFELLDIREILAAVNERRPSSSGACDYAALPSTMVSADRPLLERSLEALLGAAGQGGASIRVSGLLSEGRLCVSVQGAPPAASGLADPDRSSTSEGKAQCLSLPMARRAAKALGGDLRIESAGYSLSLPLPQSG